MNRKQAILVLLIALLVLSVCAAVLMTFYQTEVKNSQPFPFEARVYRPNPADLELYYWARTILSTINVVLISVLIVSYVSIYLRTKSEFTIGLLLFATFLLIKEVAWSPFVIGVLGFGLFGLGPFAFLPDLFEMAALLVLFYLNIKY
ncbi:hypothetical protein [Candidatus Bathycorpusculum sp.]|uniref:hypothetical protein n=1 Tax=Candidatus Bathycorpusculum sp. TaxID=2994959 RepID=UPI0028181FC4|nr:hypothetical protein [Candidatus Termitimicrobium sp.]